MNIIYYMAINLLISAFKKSRTSLSFFLAYFRNSIRHLCIHEEKLKIDKYFCRSFNLTDFLNKDKRREEKSHFLKDIFCAKIGRVTNKSWTWHLLIAPPARKNNVENTSFKKGMWTKIHPDVHIKWQECHCQMFSWVPIITMPTVGAFENILYLNRCVHAEYNVDLWLLG